MISKKRFSFLFGILIIFVFSCSLISAFDITINSPVQDNVYSSSQIFNYSTDADIDRIIGRITYSNGSDIYPMGNNWTQRSGATNWNQIVVSATGQYQIAGIWGSYFYVSNDYGQTWTQKGVSAYWDKPAISATGQYQTISVGYGSNYIYVSNDYGQNWNTKSVSQLWGDVSMTSTGQYQVIGSATYPYVSNDYGQNWTQKTVPQTSSSFAISATGQYWIMVKWGGYVYVSNDSGNNWTQQTSLGSSAWITPIISATGQYQMVIQHGGVVYVSNDYGQTWTQRRNTGYWVNGAISATGQYLLIGIGSEASDYLYFSNDYGQTWTQKRASADHHGSAISATGQYMTTGVYGSYIYTSNNSMISFLSNTTETYNTFNLAEGNYTAEVWVLNTSGIANTTTVNFTVDTTAPTFNFQSPTPSNLSSYAIFTVNATITEPHLQNVTWNFNGTQTFFNTTNESLNDLGNGNWLFTYNQTGLVTGQNYTFNISASDSVGNGNTSETRTIYGTNHLTFSNIYTTPNSTGDVDPNVNINISANISDEDNLFNSAILQWRNSTDTEWNNVSMENTTEIFLSTLVLGNFTLPEYEGNITFRIWANNTFGDSAYSDNSTLESFWDCTWEATSSLGETAGWSENKFIGNITINNTGDYNYSDNHCSLDFRLTYNLDEGRIYYDGEYFKNLIVVSGLSAKSSQNISINATFLSEITQESVNITLDEGRDRSSIKYSNTTATLISNQEGPYLYQLITAYPTSVYLTSGTFSLSGYLRNLMGSSEVNENNTAYNVTFYWTLPSEFINSSGSTIINYTNLTEKNTNYNNINVGFSNLASMSPGIETISLSSYGYNLSGDLIEDVNGNTLLTNQINISFLCYTPSDGVCVSACGYLLDSDCSAPVITNQSDSSPVLGGGGGGGSSGTIGETISSNENLQLVRGRENSLVVEFKNTDINHSIYNANFSVSGNLAKYILVSPSYIAEILPQTSANITLYITSPTYISLGKNKLSVMLSGRKIGSYQDQKNLIIEIHDISTQEAIVLLEELKNLSEEMKSKEILITEELNFKMNETEKCLNNFSYELLVENYNSLKLLMNSALNAKQIIDEISSLINIAIEKGIDISGSDRLIQTAILALDRGEYEEALSRANEAKTTYALEVKGEFGNLSYYLKNNYREISLGAVLLFISGFAFYKFGKLSYIKTKIKDLKKEEKILEDLIRLVQEETFIKKQMSIEEYHETLLHYENRMAQIIKKIIELENQRAFLLKFVSAIKKLSVEREKILELIKELQRDYMQKKNIETNTYDLRLRSYNKRLGEIDSEIANYEAKKAKKNLKKGELGK